MGNTTKFPKCPEIRGSITPLIPLEAEVAGTTSKRTENAVATQDKPARTTLNDLRLLAQMGRGPCNWLRITE